MIPFNELKIVLAMATNDLEYGERVIQRGDAESLEIVVEWLQAAQNTRYLIRRGSKKAAAHIWNGSDTSCRMASTGDLGRAVNTKYSVTTTPRGHEICTMCQTNADKVK